MREIEFGIDGDIPRSKTDAVAVKYKLRALQADLGIWGRGMRCVGLGFHWTTKTLLADQGPHPLLKLQRGLWRWLRYERIIAGDARAALLESRFTYIHVGDPTGIITLREE